MASFDDEGKVEIDSEKIGDKFYNKAVNKIQSRNIFLGEERYRKAMEYYEQAVAAYADAEVYPKAAKTCLEMAEAYKKHFVDKKDAFGSYHQLSKYYEQAGDMMDNYNHEEAADVYEKACYYRQSDNNFTGAASLYMAVAGRMEDRQMSKRAATFYEKAADAFLSGNARVQGAQCLAMKARIVAQSGEYREAARLFKDIVVKGYASVEDLALCFKSLLCIFVYASMRDSYDMVIKHDQELGEICAKWNNSYEHRVMMKLMAAYEKGANGVRAFTKACADYDTVSSLDSWTTQMLVKIKRVLAGRVSPILQDDDDSDEEDMRKKVLAPVKKAGGETTAMDSDEELPEDDIADFFDFDAAVMGEVKSKQFEKTQSEQVADKLI